jgi:outer membrane protein TolC
VNRQEVIALALARRGEIAQAATAAQVTDYEVKAQGTRWLPSMRTFASGSDIHAQSIPYGNFEENYKPGAVGLEMPTQLVGSRSHRIDQAQAYNARAEAFSDKTRGLIALEAEQAYLRWLEASRKAKDFEKAMLDAEALAQGVRKDFRPDDAKITINDLLDASVLASQLRVQFNQARYQEVLALAALERVTAGGFCARLDALPVNKR